MCPKAFRHPRFIHTKTLQKVKCESPKGPHQDVAESRGNAVVYGEKNHVRPTVHFDSDKRGCWENNVFLRSTELVLHKRLNSINKKMHRNLLKTDRKEKK